MKVNNKDYKDYSELSSYEKSCVYYGKYESIVINRKKYYHI